jgi:hypothetical protein
MLSCPTQFSLTPKQISVITFSKISLSASRRSGAIAWVLHHEHIRMREEPETQFEAGDSAESDSFEPGQGTAKAFGAGTDEV